MLTASSDQITRDYFDSIMVETRYMDGQLPNMEMSLFGEKFNTPIMTAALSHLNGTCENGMVEYAKAAHEVGAVHWVGMGEDEELENIVATGARSIKIIKPHADNKEVFRRIEHANKIGCFAVGMDIDHAFCGEGGYDVVLGLPMKPKSVEEMKEFVAASSVPFVVKGVLSAKDAEKCVEAGAKGIVVSHHHGIMDYCVPPLLVLPEILSAVDHQLSVFVDCGIVSAMDAFKALALGADAVSVGRELMTPLKGGYKPVAERMVQMTNQLSAIMARCGATNLKDIDPTVLHFRQF